MSLSKVVTGAMAVTALFTTACIGGNVEGTYRLDKGEVRRSMEAEIEKMRVDEKETGKLGLAIVDAMEDIELTLAADGKANMKTFKTGPVPLGGDRDRKLQEKWGTWKKNGDEVVIDIDGTPTTCTASAGALKCDPEKAGEPALTFKK